MSVRVHLLPQQGLVAVSLSTVFPESFLDLKFWINLVNLPNTNFVLVIPLSAGKYIKEAVEFFLTELGGEIKNGVK